MEFYYSFDFWQCSSDYFPHFFLLPVFDVFLVIFVPWKALIFVLYKPRLRKIYIFTLIGRAKKKFFFWEILGENYIDGELWIGEEDQRVPWRHWANLLERAFWSWCFEDPGTRKGCIFLLFVIEFCLMHWINWLFIWLWRWNWVACWSVSFGCWIVWEPGRSCF